MAYATLSKKESCSHERRRETAQGSPGLVASSLFDCYCACVGAKRATRWRGCRRGVSAAEIEAGRGKAATWARDLRRHFVGKQARNRKSENREKGEPPEVPCFYTENNICKTPNVIE
ncbi:hypothetical protein NDU88_002125 [Pleurodeles waltl]|uniref:Uncharacterized protein n=1 Tax=Pleurodeles waltl TaxID=8319 RepID=A0AAV7KSN5_PLEWA|nr:hypothetical protein NDU88_002125 [Pleurodeles waltl]